MLDRFSDKRLFTLLVPVLQHLSQRFPRDPPQQPHVAYTSTSEYDPLDRLLDLGTRLDETDLPPDGPSTHLFDNVPSTVYQADERFRCVITRSTAEFGYPCVTPRSVGVSSGKCLEEFREESRRWCKSFGVR